MESRKGGRAKRERKGKERERGGVGNGRSGEREEGEKKRRKRGTGKRHLLVFAYTAEMKCWIKHCFHSDYVFILHRF